MTFDASEEEFLMLFEAISHSSLQKFELNRSALNHAKTIN